MMTPRVRYIRSQTRLADREGAGAIVAPFLRHAETRGLSVHFRAQITDFDDRIGGYLATPRSRQYRFGVRRLVKAVRLLLVGTEKRKEPLDPFLVIDLFDPLCCFVCHFKLLSEISLNHETWHGDLLFRRDALLRVGKISNLFLKNF
jgi:hypothetical protein